MKKIKIVFPEHDFDSVLSALRLKRYYFKDQVELMPLTTYSELNNLNSSSEDILFLLGYDPKVDVVQNLLIDLKNQTKLVLITRYLKNNPNFICVPENKSLLETIETSFPIEGLLTYGQSLRALYTFAGSSELILKVSYIFDYILGASTQGLNLYDKLFETATYDKAKNLIEFLYQGFEITQMRPYLAQYKGDRVKVFSSPKDLNLGCHLTNLTKRGFLISDVARALVEPTEFTHNLVLMYQVIEHNDTTQYYINIRMDNDLSETLEVPESYDVQNITKNISEGLEALFDKKPYNVASTNAGYIQGYFKGLPPIIQELNLATIDLGTILTAILNYS